MPHPEDSPTVPADTCPTLAELACFALGNLPHARMAAVERHLSQCAPCRDLLALSSETNDDLMDALRRPAEHEPFDQDSERQLVERVYGAVAPVRGEPGQTGGGVGPGSTIGAYRLIEAIGQGGYGVVYRAHDTASQQPVAVKLLLGVASARPRALTRFRRELEILQALQHENVVTAVEGGEYRGLPYLTMEWIDGLSLAAAVRRSGALSVPAACDIARQVAEGLQYTHERGIVHRDLKPSNLMLTRAGLVRILDFGLALLKQDDPAGRRLTSSGHILGAADYVAPEQIDDSRRVDQRADLYSLGCVLYVLLAGHPPFGGGRHRSTIAKLFAHRCEPAAPLEQVAPHVRPDAAALVGELLAKSPADRPGTAAEVAGRLRPWSDRSETKKLAERWLSGV